VLCGTVSPYGRPFSHAGMTQKQITEAVHLRKFEDMRLEREARIKERFVLLAAACRVTVAEAVALVDVAIVVVIARLLH
jgi:hypothetical protein